ncbi:MAG: dihydrodipicolinate synthase family protein, partial [Verrucomicrobiota bacterium]|nr:dihydrodipicolinate synthase family protein [Verrucomicrobiota bacterium]
MFTGVYTALITPFRNGQLDEAAFKRLVELQIKAGVDGIVPVGTTGESPTLDFEEHIRVIELAVYYAHGHAKVMAGTGANSTA